MVDFKQTTSRLQQQAMHRLQAGRNQRRGVRPQPKSAIRSGQGVLGWLGSIIRWIVLIIVIMVLISYGRKAYNIGYSIFSDKAMASSADAEKVTIEITSAMTVDEIGQLLEDNGLLADGSVFRYQERFSSYHDEIKPGTYTLTTDMTPTEILKAISPSAASDEASTEAQ